MKYFFGNYAIKIVQYINTDLHICKQRIMCVKPLNLDLSMIRKFDMSSKSDSSFLSSIQN